MEHKTTPTKTTLDYRVNQIRLILCDGKNDEFAAKIGKKKQYASAICNGQKQAGKGTLEAILTAFPNVSRSWLYFGEGEMLLTDSPSCQPTQAHTNNAAINEEIAILRRDNAHLSDYINMLKDKVVELEGELQREKEKVKSLLEKTNTEEPILQ